MSDSRYSIDSAQMTPEDVATTLREPPFPVPFLGETIACKTTADVEMVKLAEAALNG